MMANHITQEAYIKKIMGPDGFLLFHNDLYRGYCWDLVTDYSHPTLMYNKGRGKSILSKYDPEKKGRGTAPVLSKYETNIHSILNSIIQYQSSNACLIESQVNNLIINGMTMIARFAAMKVLEENGSPNACGEDFNEIMKSLIDNSKILIKPKDAKWDDVINNIIIWNKGMEEYTRKNFIGKLDIRTLAYKDDLVILSDSPVFYRHSHIIYPQSSKELLSIRIKNESNDKTDKVLLNTNCLAWIDLVCQNSYLYLIAHKNFPQNIQQVIKKSYEDKYYELIQI